MSREVRRVLFLFIPFFLCCCVSEAEIQMIGSELVGYDADGGKYLINVSETNENVTGKFDLQKIDGIYYTAQGDKVSFVSKKGVLDSGNNLLHLDEDVVIIYNSEYDIKTERVSFDFKKNLFFNKDHTTISGEGRKVISKSGFVSYLDKKLIDFLGPVESIFAQK